LYALWLWFRDPDFKSWPMRLLILAGLASIPVLWFGPPWAGSGQPFLAATHAAEYNGHLGSDPFRTVVARGVNLQVLPALVFALAAVVIGWLRHRNRLLLILGGAVAAWWVVVVAMILDGYPGLERFFLPAAARTCVLAGVGVVLLAQLAADAAHGPAVAVGAGVALVLVLISIPFTTSRISEARASFPAASQAVRTLSRLSDAVAAVGGR